MSENRPRPYFIYELVFAVNNGRPGGPTLNTFYVGLTTDPKGRYAQHAVGDDNREKTDKFLLAKNYPDTFSIEMRILDSTLDMEEAKRLEAFWIMYHTLEGHVLTNTQAGTSFYLYLLDDKHLERLSKMLHDKFGCCQSSQCVYHSQPEVAYAYASQITPQVDITKPDGFKDFFRQLWGR